VCTVFLCQKRLKLSRKVDECKPVPPSQQVQVVGVRAGRHARAVPDAAHKQGPAARRSHMEWYHDT